MIDQNMLISMNSPSCLFSITLTLSPTPPPGGRGYHSYNQFIPPSPLEEGCGGKRVNLREGEKYKIL